MSCLIITHGVNLKNLVNSLFILNINIFCTWVAVAVAAAAVAAVAVAAAAAAAAVVAAAALEEEQVRHLLNLHQNKASLSHVNH